MSNNEYDLFDVLDISHREDSYSRLLVEILRQHEDIRTRIFSKLTGHTPISWDKDPRRAVRFREGLAQGSAGKHKQNIPDLCLVAETKAGMHWLLIENKIWSNEGPSQCQRYQAAAESSPGTKEISGCYLTLQGEPPLSRVWPGRTHLDVHSTIDAMDTHNRISDDPVLGAAWLAFGKRLQHHHRYPNPKSNQCIADYLQRPAEYFVTRADRCARLAQAVRPSGWESSGSHYQRMGREHNLLQVWRNEWLGTMLNIDTDLAMVPIDKHLSLHFEIKLPAKGDHKSLSTIKCAVHFETSPYMTQRALEKHREFYKKFEQVTKDFQEFLHAGIKGSEWVAHSYALEKASIDLTFDSPPTVDDLSRRLQQVMDTISDVMTDSLERAKKAAKKLRLNQKHTLVHLHNSEPRRGHLVLYVSGLAT